jgi:uncharacterized protein (TIGR00255 family)
MTGFAALTRDEPAALVSVTARAVNHRYLDLQLRLPAALADQEVRIRGMVQSRVARGRIELAVAVQSRRAPAVDVVLNEPFVASLTAALERARAEGLVDGTLAAGDLVRLPQALIVREVADEPTAELADAVAAACERALDELEAMRVREGAFLRADLDGRLAALAELVDRLDQAARTGRVEFEARLARRVEEVSREHPADPVALAQEIVRTVARADISEELSRLRGHVQHWADLVAAPPPCGRKLDFLLQEMNREVNTLGAKAEGPGFTELVVAAKAELEKMREQVQNVE